MSKNVPLDSDLDALIKEAKQWSSKMDSSSHNGRKDDAVEERDACLTAIANAITNYVTDEIMRRLVVPSEPTPPLIRPQTISSQKPSSRCTPPSESRQRSNSRPRVVSQPATPLMTRSSLQKSSVYHSENRLDRFSPCPRPNETPLENKASRLRRMSTERRLRN